MFQREERAGNLLGYSLQHKHAFFFFGSQAFTRDDLWTVFPEYDFAFLKQVHGKAVIDANPASACEADAHFTNFATRAPVIQTADCVPVLLASKSRVCAVHAGWRGVAQNIIAATKPHFTDDRVQFAAIGPHILVNSFEVGQDVSAQLQAAAPDPSKAIEYLRSHPSADKTYFDLAQLVRDQLTASYGGQLKIFECLHDTKTDHAFSSFRRDGKQAGRNLSFVVLNA
ncbi:MAG: polyphenol oxidase family protein [Bdellovibrionales bacterium]|nr:polyphenol oxidase family protein [Bdellovibrionales bacterium]